MKRSIPTTNKNKRGQRGRSPFIRGMTLMEILITVSLMSVISITLYHCLTQGLKVWEQSRRLVIEEDIVIFFDQISGDLRNAFAFSKIKFDGHAHRLVFPTIVNIESDSRSGDPKGTYIDQVGEVEYFFDAFKKVLYKRTVGYGQALKKKVGKNIQLMVSGIDDIKFRYVYLTDNGEIFSNDVLQTLPAEVEIEAHFTDRFGRRMMRKIIDIPAGG